MNLAIHTRLPKPVILFLYKVYFLKERMKILAVAPVRCLNLNSKKFGPPRGMISLAGCLGKSWLKFTTVAIHTWRLRPPEDCRADITLGIIDQAREHTWTSSITLIEKGRVLGPESIAIITPEDQIVAELSPVVGRPISAHPALAKLKLPPVTRFQGKLAVLSVNWCDNYFHWVIEVLGRLCILQNYAGKIDAYYVPNSKKFQSDSLSFFGVSAAKVIHPESAPHVEADHIIVPARPHPGVISPEMVSSFRKVFTPNPPPSPRRRIFITRNLGSRRRVKNESNLNKIFARFGIETIAAEKLSFAEQVALFNSAEWVIGPHGAGLTNIIFCQKGTKILECFTSEYVNGCYWAIAGAADLKYYCLIDGDDGKTSYEQGPNGRADMNINPQKLEKILTNWTTN